MVDSKRKVYTLLASLLGLLGAADIFAALYIQSATIKAIFILFGVALEIVAAILSFVTNKPTWSRLPRKNRNVLIGILICLFVMVLVETLLLVHYQQFFLSIIFAVVDTVVIAVSIVYVVLSFQQIVQGETTR